MSATRFRYLFALVAVLACASILGSVSAASAASQPARPSLAAKTSVRHSVSLAWSTTARTTAKTSAGQFIGCSFGIDKPFFLTKNSNKMYTSGGVSTCTSPAPEACKLTVEILGENGVQSVVVKQAVRDWGPCSNKKPLSAGPFTCHVTPEKFEFAGQATLQVEVNGNIDSSTKGSGNVAFFCQV
jgi:hypothetical protein